jgi:hypothetical protein
LTECTTLEFFFVNTRKLLLVGAVAVLIGAFFVFDLGRFFSLEYVKSPNRPPSKPIKPHTRGGRLGSFFTVYVAVSTGCHFPARRS